ncbi:MAG: hypothetical protein WKF31_06755 [Thermoleophilaceae bacterium]
MTAGLLLPHRRAGARPGPRPRLGVEAGRASSRATWPRGSARVVGVTLVAVGVAAAAHVRLRARRVHARPAARIRRRSLAARSAGLLVDGVLEDDLQAVRSRPAGGRRRRRATCP